MANLSMEAEPVASSAPEQVTQSQESEAPQAEAPQEQVQSQPQEREKYIPRERFDEVYSKWKAAEEERVQARELLTQVLSQPGYASQSEPEAQGGEAEQVLRKLAPHLQSIQDQVFGLKDERDREAFWRENDVIAQDVKDEVETRLTAFRRQGYKDIKRDDLLAYAIGARQLPELKKKARQASVPPPVNKVAHAESGPSARAPVGKDIATMTPAELDALPLEVLREYLKDKTF